MFLLVVLCAVVVLFLTFLLVVLLLCIKTLRVQQGRGSFASVAALYTIGENLPPPPKRLAARCAALGEKIDMITSRRNNSKNVSELVYKVAFQLGVPHEEAIIYFCAAMVYDAGFLALPPDLLIAKSLSGDDWDEMKSHVDKAEKYLGFVPKEYREIFLDAATKHHENMDGSGYPFALSGEAIPLIARLIHVCESYVSIISVRNYRDIKDRESAIEELEAKSELYDSAIVAALREII